MALLLAFTGMTGLAGCAGATGNNGSTEDVDVPIFSIDESDADDGEETEKNADSEKEQNSAEERNAAEKTDNDGRTETLDPNGVYTSKEDVSLYIYTYGELPENFITKKEARKLGWQGGSLEEYAPGKCIGGDYFGNNEGLLPEDEEYHECDIDTLGKKKRGAKRLVYSDDAIYYTEDHYRSFELLYGEE